MALNGLYCADVPLSNYSVTLYKFTFYLLTYLLTIASVRVWGELDTFWKVPQEM